MALVFRAPHSYTGEDVVELSCHGGIFVLDRIMQELIKAGAVPAGPGEFTRRAFLNGKKDLAQAESVMSLIGASGEAALRSANEVMSGRTGRTIDSVRAGLVKMASALAAWTDYPDDDIPAVRPGELTVSLRDAASRLRGAIDRFDDGRVLSEGIDAVICGRPNVGKSTLMNLLSGFERAIVTDEAGTTRDVVEQTVSCGGLTLRLSDTAGLREAGGTAEKMGVELAKKKIDSADLIIAVFDISQPLTSQDRELCGYCAASGRRRLAVLNKDDLGEKADISSVSAAFDRVLIVSAKDPSAADKFAELLRTMYQPGEALMSAPALVTQRQRSCCLRALTAVNEALDAIASGYTPDCAAVCIDDAIRELGRFSGESVSDAVVAGIFRDFCVGK